MGLYARVHQVAVARRFPDLKEACSLNRTFQLRTQNPNMQAPRLVVSGIVPASAEEPFGVLTPCECRKALLSKWVVGAFNLTR